MNRDIRESFPAARNFTYLNTAAIGPMPTATVDAVTSQLAQVANAGSAKLCEWLATKNRVRGLAASMLGGNAADVAWTRNTSDGLCAVAGGMKWMPRDNIVSCANEFPANYYPWRTVRDQFGVELRLCPERNGRVDLDELCSMIDGRTRLVAVSAVQYASGQRMDLERIGKIARRHDALFAVDIIQAFGAMAFDLPAQYVDIAAGAGYKWLCAPEGCGILYVNERARDRIKPRAYGWTAVEHPWDFADRDQQVLCDARRWETGMSGTALLCGLEASLKLLLSAGLEKIAVYLQELTDFLCEIIPLTRYEIASPRLQRERSQIVALRPLNGMTASQVESDLAREHVTVSARGDLVRVAPHFFNTFEDIEKFANCLP
jgi:cysteine desulfurase / selenocysteine lyase